MPGGGLAVEVRNRVGEGQLNEGCGAEWAQKVGGRTSIFELYEVECAGSGMECFSHGEAYYSRGFAFRSGDLACNLSEEIPHTHTEEPPARDVLNPTGELCVQIFKSSDSSNHVPSHLKQPQT